MLIYVTELATTNVKGKINNRIFEFDKNDIAEKLYILLLDLPFIGEKSSNEYFCPCLWNLIVFSEVWRAFNNFEVFALNYWQMFRLTGFIFFFSSAGMFVEDKGMETRSM